MRQPVVGAAAVRRPFVIALLFLCAGIYPQDASPSSQRKLPPNIYKHWRRVKSLGPVLLQETGALSLIDSATTLPAEHVITRLNLLERLTRDKELPTKLASALRAKVDDRKSPANRAGKIFRDEEVLRISRQIFGDSPAGQGDLVERLKHKVIKGPAHGYVRVFEVMMNDGLRSMSQEDIEALVNEANQIDQDVWAALRDGNALIRVTELANQLTQTLKGSATLLTDEVVGQLRDQVLSAQRDAWREKWSTGQPLEQEMRGQLGQMLGTRLCEEVVKEVLGSLKKKQLAPGRKERVIDAMKAEYIALVQSSRTGAELDEAMGKLRAKVEEKLRPSTDASAHTVDAETLKTLLEQPLYQTIIGKLGVGFGLGQATDQVAKAWSPRLVPLVVKEVLEKWVSMHGAPTVEALSGQLFIALTAAMFDFFSRERLNLPPPTQISSAGVLAENFVATIEADAKVSFRPDRRTAIVSRLKETMVSLLSMRNGEFPRIAVLERMEVLLNDRFNELLDYAKDPAYVMPNASPKGEGGKASDEVAAQ